MPGTHPVRIPLPFFTEAVPRFALFANEPSPFVRQAAAFLDAIESRGEGRNPPEDALLDVEIAAAISISAQEHRTVSLVEMR